MAVDKELLDILACPACDARPPVSLCALKGDVAKAVVEKYRETSQGRGARRDRRASRARPAAASIRSCRTSRSCSSRRRFPRTPGRPDPPLRLIPEPIARRSGLERATFVFFLLGVGCVPGIGVANVCLALCLASALAWRWRARRAGEDFLGPFRRPTPLHLPIGAFVLFSVLSCFFSTLPSRSIIQVKGFGTFLLVVFAAALLDDAADVKLAVDVWRTTALYLVLRGFVEWISGARNLDLRVSGGMSVYMTYAGLLLVFVPLLGARGTSGGSRAARWADAGIALLGALAMALTLTRGAYVGLAVGRLRRDPRRAPPARAPRALRDRSLLRAHASPRAGPARVGDEPAGRHDERPPRDVEGGRRDDRRPAVLRRRARARQGPLSRLPRPRLGRPAPGAPPQQRRDDRGRDGDPVRSSPISRSSARSLPARSGS